MTYVAMMECNQPFSDPPELSVAFLTGGRRYRYLIPLPVLMTSFLAPAQLAGDSFTSRWDRLCAPGLEASQTVQTSLR